MAGAGELTTILVECRGPRKSPLLPPVLFCPYHVPIPVRHVSQAEGWLGTSPGGTGALEATVPSCSPDRAPLADLPPRYTCPAVASRLLLPRSVHSSDLSDPETMQTRLPWGPSLSWPGRSHLGSSASQPPETGGAWAALRDQEPPRTLPPPPPCRAGTPGEGAGLQSTGGVRELRCGAHSREGALRPGQADSTQGGGAQEARTTEEGRGGGRAGALAWGPVPRPWSSQRGAWAPDQAEPGKQQAPTEAEVEEAAKFEEAELEEEEEWSRTGVQLLTTASCPGSRPGWTLWWQPPSTWGPCLASPTGPFTPAVPGPPSTAPLPRSSGFMELPCSAEPRPASSSRGLSQPCKVSPIPPEPWELDLRHRLRVTFSPTCAVPLQCGPRSGNQAGAPHTSSITSSPPLQAGREGRASGPGLWPRWWCQEDPGIPTIPWGQGCACCPHFMHKDAKA